MNITITDHATPELKAKIAQLQGPMKASMLKAAGMEVVSMAKTAFVDDSMRPAPWAPLSAMTLAMRKAKGRRGTAPLRDSGTLYRSITVLSSDADSVTVGTDRPYARIQQFGGKVTMHWKARSATLKFNASGKFMSNKAALKQKTGSIKFALAHYKARSKTFTIPPRPFLPMDAKGNPTPFAITRIMRIIQDKLATLFK